MESYYHSLQSFSKTCKIATPCFLTYLLDNFLTKLSSSDQDERIGACLFFKTPLVGWEGAYQVAGLMDYSSLCIVALVTSWVKIQLWVYLCT